jgi:hypothetical protein
MWRLGLVWVVFVSLWGATDLMAQEDGNTPMAAPASADLPLAGLAYTADFGGELNWTEGAYDDGTLDWSASDEGLLIRSLQADGPARFVPGTSYVAANFYAEFTFTPLACASEESAMLFNVRSDPASANPTSASAYVFVIQCDGTYRSRPILEGRSGLIDFSGQLDSPPQVGVPMQVGVLVQGRQVTWYVDGVELGLYFANSSPQVGQFAFGAQIGLTARVSRLQVWEVEAPETAQSTPEAMTSDRPSDNPLPSAGRGRNIAVITFRDPVTPLIAAYNTDLPAYLAGGLLVIGPREPQSTQTRYLAQAPDPNSYEAYLIESAFQARACAEDGGFGLALGAPEALTLAFILQCDGRFRLEDGAGTVLGTGQVRPLERFGFGTLLGLVVRGEAVYAYINEDLAASAFVSRANQAQMGYIWQATDSLTEVGLESFIVSELFIED